MKKLSALLLALCLLFSVAVAEDAVVLNWDSVSQVADDVGGQWLAINDLGLVLWAPNDLYVVEEIPDEYADKDVKGMFISRNDETGEITGTITFQYIEANGADVMECVNAIEGAANAKAMVINGLPCVNYDMPEEDATCVAYATEKGNLFVISFLPVSDEAFAGQALLMMASIQNAQ